MYFARRSCTGRFACAALVIPLPMVRRVSIQLQYQYYVSPELLELNLIKKSLLCTYYPETELTGG
jgi:hypothetical protein